MTCPFPGIDPYVEGRHYWPDFHAGFLIYCRDALTERLPDHYEARIDEQFRLVQVADDPPRTVEPDLAILRTGATPWAGRIAAAGTAVLEPVTIPIPMTLVEEVRERRIEIRRLPDRKPVAVVELLSPTNKAQGWEEYQSKRLALFGQPVHLIEFDFLLAGRRLPMARPLPAGDYYAFVARAERRPDCNVYAWPIRHTLPTVPIPLLPPDPDVSLDLAAVYATAHARGRYARALDYAAPLGLPLAPADRAWVEECGRSARR